MHICCPGYGGARVVPPFVGVESASITPFFALIVGKWNSFSSMNCKLWIINSLPKVIHWPNPVLPCVNWFWVFSFGRDFCHHWDQSSFALMHGSPAQQILCSLFNFWRGLSVENPLPFSYAFALHFRIMPNNSNAHSKRQAFEYLNLSI